MKLITIIDYPPLLENGFLVIGENGSAVAIDPGASAARFEKALEENNAKLTHILLTHGHYDHVGAVLALQQKLGAKVFIHKADLYLPDFSKQGTGSIVPDGFFEDGGNVQVDEMEFKTVFTPGHTPGSVCILCGEWMFSGDTLFAGDIGRTDLPGGNSAHMKESLKKICKEIAGNPQVLPGHEEFSTLDEEKKTNPYLRA